MAGSNIKAWQVDRGTGVDQFVILEDVGGGTPGLPSVDARSILNLDTSQVTSGTFDDARIAQTNVTQHQSALAVDTTQLTQSGAVDGQVLSWNNTAGEWEPQTPSGGSSTGSFNGIVDIFTNSSWENPYFRLAGYSWGSDESSGGRVNFTRNDDNTINSIGRGVARMIATTGETANLTTPDTFLVDENDSFTLAMFLLISGAGGTGLTPSVDCYDYNNNYISTLTLSLSGNTSWGMWQRTINPSGGSSPAWPTGTRSAALSLIPPDNGDTFLAAIVFGSPFGRIPYSSNATAVDRTNRGTGSHEAVWDGTNLFICAHSFSQIAKMNEKLERIDEITIASDPHDIADGGNGALYVPTYGGATLEEIDKASMTVTNSIGLLNARTGFGVVVPGDGSVYVGAGNSGNAESPAIIQFDSLDLSVASQSVISSDVDGGAANIPIAYLNGDLWSINSPDNTLSEIKRISTGGTTQATITTSIEKIYGLGTDGTYLYANGTLGIVKIDPSTNSVVETYYFKHLSAGYTNLKHQDGKMWGGAQGASGFFYLNISEGQLYEWPQVNGAPKWVAPMTSSVAAGTFWVPHLFEFNK